MGNRGNDRLIGGSGNDRLFGKSGADFLDGGAGADLLIGGNGGDVLRGRRGEDNLNGGVGNDWLFSGAGKDRLTGGEGHDRFVFVSAIAAGLGESRDVITDFIAGTDIINLKRITPDQIFVADAALSSSAGEVRYDTSSGVLEGDLDGDGVADYQLQLLDVVALSASDLVL